jgi:hypothetical protein
VVFTVTPDDKARRVLVKTGMQKEGKVEIVTGLAAQDQVVVRGHSVLVDGAPVTRRSPEGGEGGQSLNAAAERRGTGSL